MGKAFLNLATEKTLALLRKSAACSCRVFIVGIEQVFARFPSKHLLSHGHSQQ